MVGETGGTTASEVLRRVPDLRRFALVALRDYGIVAIFVGLFVALTLASDAFLTKTNLLNILDQSAPLGIIACGMTIVIIGGGFDLSVGAVYALSSITAASLTNDYGAAVGLTAGLVVAVGLGAVNGALITLFRINSFIATLASGFMFRGIAVLITGGFLITVTSDSFRIIGRESFISVKYTIWTFVVVVALSWFLLTRTTLGRRIFAVGGNEEAARLSGIRVGWIRVITFAISGLAAGLAGIVATSKIATAQAASATGIELAAIAAVVIGGTSIWGGEGAIWRTVLGVLLLALIGNGFNILGVDPLYQSIVQGGIILVAVAADALNRRNA